MNVKKCTNCNKDISIDAKFCGFCGAQLSTVKPAKVKKKTVLRNGKQISFAAIFLLYLGIAYFSSIGYVITAFHERSLEL